MYKEFREFFVLIQASTKNNIYRNQARISAIVEMDKLELSILLIFPFLF